MSAQKPALWAAVPCQLVLLALRVYAPLWWILELGAFLYKGSRLPFPDGRWGAEFGALFAWVPVELARAHFSAKGNRSGGLLPGILGAGLALPPIGFYLYLLLAQTYVLGAEVGLNAVNISLTGLAFFLGVLSVASSPRPKAE